MHPGARRPPDPAIYGLAAPSVLPPCCLRGTRQDLPCTSAWEPRPRGQQPRRLTDLLTRPGGTGETLREVGDAQLGDRQVSETRRNAGDEEDVRRGAHNPEVAGSNPAPATK